MFSVHSHRESGMPPRAVCATRDDAVRAGAGLGIAPEDLHIEARDDEGAFEALRAMAQGMTSPKGW